MSERQFACPSCDRKFKVIHDLGRHRILHLAIDDPERVARTLFCRYGCGHKALQKYNLLRHERRHEQELPYECEICNKHFGDPSQVLHHRVKEHGYVPEPRERQTDIARAKIGPKSRRIRRMPYGLASNVPPNGASSSGSSSSTLQDETTHYTSEIGQPSTDESANGAPVATHDSHELSLPTPLTTSSSTTPHSDNSQGFYNPSGYPTFPFTMSPPGLDSLPMPVSQPWLPWTYPSPWNIDIASGIPAAPTVDNPYCEYPVSGYDAAAASTNFSTPMQILFTNLASSSLSGWQTLPAFLVGTSIPNCMPTLPFPTGFANFVEYPFFDFQTDPNVPAADAFQYLYDNPMNSWVNIPSDAQQNYDFNFDITTNTEQTQSASSTVLADICGVSYDDSEEANTSLLQESLSTVMSAPDNDSFGIDANNLAVSPPLSHWTLSLSTSIYGNHEYDGGNETEEVWDKE